MTIIDEILGGIISALLVTLAVLLVMNANLRADVATLRANAAMLGSANAALKDEADRQNRAVIALKFAGEARAAASARAVRAADAQATKYLNRAAQIEKTRITGGDCDAAMTILQDYRAQNAR